MYQISFRCHAGSSFLLLAVVVGIGWANEQPTPHMHLQWAHRCDGSIQTDPIVHGGTLFFGSMDGFVHAIDAADGQPKWRAELGGMIVAPPVVDAARVQLLVGCDDGHVYALALGDGKVKWKHRTPGDWTVIAGPQVKGRPVVTGDRVLVTNLLGHVEALRATDGATIWKAAGFGFAGGSPAPAGDKFLFTSTRRGMVCLDSGSGKLVWEKKIGRSFSTPTVADGVVYVGAATGPGWASKGAVFALDLATGKQRWRHSPGGSGHFAGQVVGGPLVAGDLLVAADIEGRIFGLDRESGQQRWATKAAAVFWAGGCLVGQNAWFASTDGQLLAVKFDRGGKIVQKIAAHSPLWTTPVVHGGRLYQATDDGYILCFGAKPKTKVPRPKIQTTLRFKHPSTRKYQLLHEFIGTISALKSKPFGGPPKESELRGKQLHFTFQLKVERGGKGPDGKSFPAGQSMQVVSRPLTNYFHWNCSPTFTGLAIDWTRNQRVRVVGSYETPVLNPYADGSTKPRPLCAYIIQREPKPDTLIPVAHWPAWYVNNWVHFMCDIEEAGHHRYFANTGYLNWGWDFVEERTMGQYLPRDVWAQVKPRYYLWRAVNSWRQIRDPRTEIVRGVPTTLTIYLSGAHHADPYYSQQTLYAPAPKISIDAAPPTVGKAPVEVKFRANIDDGGSVQFVQWSFDSVKGLTADSVDRAPTHIFTKPGKYVVSLTVVSRSGKAAHAHKIINVQP